MSKYHEWVAGLSLDKQMALMRQPYDNEDSGVPLPVVEPIPAPIDEEHIKYVADCKEQIENYLMLIEITEDESNPMELRFKAGMVSQLCLHNLGNLGMSGGEIALVIDGNFKWHP